MKKFLSNRLAADIMTKKVITVEKGTPVHEIYRLFLKNNIMGVPVIDKDKKVIGIVTERDLAVRAEEVDTPASVNLLGSIIYLGDMTRYNEMLKKQLGQLAVDVMTSPVKTLPEDTPLAEILLLMDKDHINRIPIVDSADKLTGIVTRTDIIRELIKEGKNL
jgi:CBS domain-containing protein